MELAAITTWLASAQPFAQGVALYAQVGTSKTYQRLFGLGETAYSRQVLVRELTALVGPVQEETAAVRTALPAPPVAVLPAPVRLSPTADSLTLRALDELRRQLRLVRDERSHAHAQLTAPNLGKKARYGIAARILELTDQETKLKGHEAHVLEHGRLPGPVPTADITDAGVLRQRLTNLRSQRSKLKKNPDRAADLAAAEAEILLIRSKLNP